MTPSKLTQAPTHSRYQYILDIPIEDQAPGAFPEIQAKCVPLPESREKPLSPRLNGRTVQQPTREPVRKSLRYWSEPPKLFLCPETKKLMTMPLINRLSETYSKEAFDYFKEQALLPENENNTELQEKIADLKINSFVQNSLSTWLAEHPWVVNPQSNYLQSRNDVLAINYCEMAQKMAGNPATFLEAEKLFREALRYTDSAEVYAAYAELIERMNEPAKAYRAFFNLGQLYELNKELLKAKGSYERAHALQPNKKKALKSLISIYGSLQDRVAAIDALKRLASIYKSENRLSDMCDAYKEAFTLSDRRDSECLEALLACYQEQGDVESIRWTHKQIFELYILKNPDDLHVYSHYSVFLKEQGESAASRLIKNRREERLQMKLSIQAQQIEEQRYIIEEQRDIIAAIKAQIEGRLVTTSHVQPPAEQPPAEQPPAEQPPAEQPPAEQPPAEQPPAEQPPAEQPPAEQPPADGAEG